MIAGKEIGVQKGTELGRELGQYRGRVAVLLTMSNAHSDFAPERMRTTLQRLHALLASISLDDPRDEQCFTKLEDARAKAAEQLDHLKARSNAFAVSVAPILLDGAPLAADADAAALVASALLAQDEKDCGGVRAEDTVPLIDRRSSLEMVDNIFDHMRTDSPSSRRTG